MSFILTIVKTPKNIDDDIKELEQQIANLYSKIEVLKEFKAKLEELPPIVIPNNSSMETIRMTMIDIIERVIKENKAPMHADEILKKVEELGFKTNKASIVSSISVYVRNNQRFKALGKNVFDLIEDSKIQKA